jgi:hypothetical protein
VSLAKLLFLIYIEAVWPDRFGAKPMTKRKKTDIVPLMVRLREDLRARIEAAAKGRERSLNSEIVARLEESFDREGLNRLRERIERGLDVILAQTEKRERLLELEDQKFRRALEEEYGLTTSKKSGDTQDDWAAPAAESDTPTFFGRPSPSRPQQTTRPQSTERSDTPDDSPRQSKGGRS